MAVGEGPDPTANSSAVVEPLHDDFRDLDDAVSPAAPYRSYVRTTPQYIPGRGVTRYKSALQHLIPIRKKAKEKEVIGVDSAGFFSFITYTWMSKYMYKAFRDGFMLEDLPRCSPLDSCDYNTQRLELLWQEEIVKKGPKNASFSTVVWKFLRTRMLASGVIFTMSLCFGFISPTIFMRKMLEYAQDSDANVWEGIVWAVCLTLAEFCRTMFLAWSWAINYRTAIRLRAACLTMLYRKVIRLNKLGDYSVGQLINLFANDSQRIFDMVLFGPMIIGGPLVTIGGVFYIYWLLGPWALLGMTTFLVFYPVQYTISRLTGYLRGKTVKVTDQRVRLMSEILDYMKIIKMYAWEDSFAKSLHAIRSKERALLQKTAYCQSISISMAPTVPVISAIVTFLAHIMAGNSLTAAQAFSLVAILNNQVRNLWNVTQVATANLFDADIAIKRIKNILVLDELNSYITRPIDRSTALAMGNATFSWGNSTSTSDGKHIEPEKERLREEDAFQLNVLSNINIEVPKGHLVGICGVVGSGKTSLLLAALGQMHLLKGHVTRDGLCAYVSQEAWVLNATLRENILFGETFDAKRYYEVIYSCCLAEDINMLPGGDNTEIGERGINLSGGQKQRVALARALYANRDIYLLDDPLSAVDTQVGAHIFEKCILTALKEKTVLFVTHQVQLLSRCDEVLVMKDGHIAERGTHDELMATDLDYALMINTRLAEANTHNVSEKLNENVSGDQLVSPKKSTSDTGSGGGEQLTQKEAVGQGKLSTQTYVSYVTAAGGFTVFCVVFFSFFINVGSNVFSSWWLAVWIRAGSGNTSIVVNNQTVISDNINDNPQFSMYQIVYACNIIVILGTSVIRGYVFTKATLHASSRLHNRLFNCILQAPMSFFDTTPTGRIQNLFSRDLDEVDSRLPGTVESILQNIWMVIFSVLFLCLVFPWFMIPFFVLAVIYYFISKIFRVAVRDLKRLESVSRSPIYSFVGTTVQGLSTIHAFGKESEFIAKFTQMFDENSTCMYLCCVATRWLAVRLDVLAVSVTATTALLIILLHGQVVPAMAGLALAYSAHITGMFQYTIRLISETEVRFISIERINSYLMSVKPEGDSGEQKKPPYDWPTRGHIQFEKASLCYREGLPNVLNNVSFTAKAGEKIGIVGRTGSGKSSLVISLFRLTELSGGTIKIDGLDIAAVGLEHLRRRLSVIPQDPVLFEGTIRSNLDPFNLHNDEVLWLALEKTKLRQRISNVPGQLDSTVGNSNDILSVGERQLLCLARALLRDARVLVLDEATAAVDPETEAAVQLTIAKEFTHCTVLVIAHRLVTVTSCDRILVLSHGQVVEYDSPANLLANPNSEFARMLAVGDSTGMGM